MTLSVRNHEVAILVGNDHQRMPLSGDIRIILDGPVLEVSSAGGLYGSVIAPKGETLAVLTSGSGTVAHALVR